jgi:hypothetical protein
MKKSKLLDKVTCGCGEEILLLPDLKAMGNAIELHVTLHLQKLKTPLCNAAEAEHLKDALITQILRIASQSEDEEHR